MGWIIQKYFELVNEIEKSDGLRSIILLTILLILIPLMVILGLISRLFKRENDL